MTADQYIHLENRFKKMLVPYYKSARSVKNNIELKEVHSRQVTGNMSFIARRLRLSKSDFYLARTIGLYHDFGRFEQYRVYNSFYDQKTEDHAKLGLKTLLIDGTFDILVKAETDIIASAILNHNKFSIDGRIQGKKLIFCKMIRDADKIDIWRVMHHYYTGDPSKDPVVGLGLEDTQGYSKRLIKDPLKGKLGKMKYVKNLNDLKLVQLGLIFDLYFQPSFERISGKPYIEGIFDTLPQTTEVQKFRKVIRRYLRNKKSGPSIINN